MPLLIFAVFFIGEIVMARIVSFRDGRRLDRKYGKFSPSEKVSFHFRR